MSTHEPCKVLAKSKKDNGLILSIVVIHVLSFCKLDSQGDKEICSVLWWCKNGYIVRQGFEKGI
jgi:hypothetical protein